MQEIAKQDGCDFTNPGSSCNSDRAKQAIRGWNEPGFDLGKCGSKKGVWHPVLDPVIAKTVHLFIFPTSSHVFWKFAFQLMLFRDFLEVSSCRIQPTGVQIGVFAKQYGCFLAKQ